MTKLLASAAVGVLYAATVLSPAALLWAALYLATPTEWAGQ